MTRDLLQEPAPWPGVLRVFLIRHNRDPLTKEIQETHVMAKSERQARRIYRDHFDGWDPQERVETIEECRPKQRLRLRDEDSENLDDPTVTRTLAGWVRLYNDKPGLLASTAIEW